MNWQDIPDEREKYAAYLCSREWSVKKEAVHARAEGYCERCRRNKIDAVHHLNYLRKYNEELEDLQAICNPCHEFTHGKSNFDPLNIPGSINFEAIGTGFIRCLECERRGVFDAAVLISGMSTSLICGKEHSEQTHTQVNLRCRLGHVQILTFTEDRESITTIFRHFYPPSGFEHIGGGK